MGSEPQSFARGGRKLQSLSLRQLHICHRGDTHSAAVGENQIRLVARKAILANALEEPLSV